MSRLNIALAVVLLLALGLAVVVENRAPWRAWGTEVIQVTTPSGAVDRCPTCHQAVLDPRKRGQLHPLRLHPKLPGHEDLTRWGCTPCHGGQGRRLDREAHGPPLGGGPRPFLGEAQRQALCVRCHVPTGLAGADVLGRGYEEYLAAACTGCHHPGRSDEGLGPDLRRLGRRTNAELRAALLRPRESHGGATMWSLGWRYKKDKAPGPKALDALVVALLAMGEQTAPYRSAWARPTLRVDVDCTSCHLEVFGERERPAGARKHRCTLLRRKESKLRCAACHGAEDTRVKRTGGASGGTECPEVRAARPLCPVCHARPGDGA